MSESENDQTSVPVFEGFSDSLISSAVSVKRKRDEPEAEAKRGAKRRKSKKPKDVNDEALDNELGVNHAMAHMDSRLLADHIAQRTKRFRPEMSLIEAGDSHIPEWAIVDTTSWGKQRTAEQLPAFLEECAGSRRKKKGRTLADSCEEKGSPHTLVVAGAGLRAADLTRALRKFRTKEAMVTKLFAKHIKLKEAIETVRETRMNIGVGTPQRLIDLLDDGALSISHLERIIIDASHIDQKKRGILDMKETQVPLVRLLARQGIKERYGTGEGKIELHFF